MQPAIGWAMWKGCSSKGPLSTLLRPSDRPLPAKLSNSDRLCMTGAMWRTTCDRRHAWRAIDAVVVRTSAYPTSEQVIRAANRNCPKTWDFVRWPSEAVWAAGNHVAVCYDRTRR